MYTDLLSLGTTFNKDREIEYWTWWINERMRTVRHACDNIDMFIAPSFHLKQRFINEFGLPPEKIKYLPYGFDRSILANRHRKRSSDDLVTFGYIGRHAPSKGINLLLQAAKEIVHTDSTLANRFRIIIYGRSDPTTTSNLQEIAKAAGVIVEWRSEYKNVEIVQRVFNHVDYIVVPSIWDENSPLVIHEAQQCGVPVITANHGGMVDILAFICKVQFCICKYIFYLE